MASWRKHTAQIVDNVYAGSVRFIAAIENAQATNVPRDSITSVIATAPSSIADLVRQSATSSLTTSMATLAEQTNSLTARAAEANPKRTDTLAIVLGIVFGLVGVLFLAFLAFLCMRRRRKHGSFMYQDNASVLSDDSYVVTGTAEVSTHAKDTSTASSSPERPPTYPVHGLGIIEEKESPGQTSPTLISDRISLTRRTSSQSPSKKAELFPPYYPPIPAAHQISSLVRRHSSESSNINDYAYIPNDPFEDINHGIYNQHLQQQHLLQRVRSISRTSQQSTTLEPLREYPENNDFQEPRNPLPTDPRERSLYNYRDSHQNRRVSPHRPQAHRASPGRSSPRQHHAYRGSAPVNSFPLNPQPVAQPWPPRAVSFKHNPPAWPWPSSHSASMGLISKSKSMRAPDMLRYKRNNRRWTSEPHLLAHQSKLITRKPVPMPKRDPIPPLEKVKLPEFWWEHKYYEGSSSVESLVGTREPLRRFSFESRPEG